MHHRLVIWSAAVLSLLAAGAVEAQVTPRDPRLAAVDAVIGYRRTVMADTLSFDACTVFSVAGRPEKFPDGIRDANRGTLDRQGSRPCDNPETPARFPHRVYVDSLALSDSGGFVYLTVRRGDWLHREMFTLPRVRGGDWGVREMRVWGAIQLAPPPPRPSGSR